MAPTISRPFVPLWLARCRKQQQRSTARPWSWQERLWCLNLNPQPHDENKQEREREVVLDLSITKRGEEERLGEKKFSKTLAWYLPPTVGILSWSPGNIMSPCPIKALFLKIVWIKNQKKKKSQSKYSNKKYWASRYHKCFSFCSVCSLYRVHLPLLPVAL